MSRGMRVVCLRVCECKNCIAIDVYVHVDDIHVCTVQYVFITEFKYTCTAISCCTWILCVSRLNSTLNTMQCELNRNLTTLTACAECCNFYIGPLMVRYCN